jgi:hypothetical protein
MIMAIKAIRLTTTNKLSIVSIEYVINTIITNTSMTAISDIRIMDEIRLHSSCLPPYRIIVGDFIILYDCTNHDLINKFVSGVLPDDIVYNMSPIRGDVIFIKYIDNEYISVCGKDIKYIRGLQISDHSKSICGCVNK